MPIGPMIHKQTWLLDRVELQGTLRELGKSPTDHVGTSADLYIEPDPGYEHLASVLGACRRCVGTKDGRRPLFAMLPTNQSSLKCEAYSFDPAERHINRDVPWWGKPDKDPNDGKDVLVSLADGSGQRELRHGDRVRLLGRWTIDTHPEACETQYPGIYVVGAGHPELHPYDWEHIVLVSDPQPGDTVAKTLSLAAPLFEEVFSSYHNANVLQGLAWLSKNPPPLVRLLPGYRPGRFGHVYVAPDGSNFHNTVSATMEIRSPRPPDRTAGGVSRPAQLHFTETDVVRNTGASIDAVRSISILPDGIRVSATVSAPASVRCSPEPGYTGKLPLVADPDNPHVFQARYTVGWLTGCDLHLAATTDAGSLMYTQRHPDGSWNPGFDDLEKRVGELGLLGQVAAARIGGELHLLSVVAAPVTGATISRPGRPRPVIKPARGEIGRDSWPSLPAPVQLVHTIRTASGGWGSWGDVEGQSGDIGDITQVAAAGAGGALHVVAVSSSGSIRHAMRASTGVWTKFVDVEAAGAGEAGTIWQVAAAGRGDDLEVLAITDSGRLLHTTRSASGAWSAFNDLKGAAGDIGIVTHAAISASPSLLHVVAVNSSGGLMHTARSAQGGWTGFGDVEGQTGDLGLAARVAASVAGEDLHLVVTTSSGGLMHTIRTSWGAWFGFGDVEFSTDDIGFVKQVAIACIG